MIGSNQYELTWNHFDQLHSDKKTAFENLSRALFQRKLCQEGTILHSDPNHPGIEVAPVLAKDGQTKISFQAKHFNNAIDYRKITQSIQEVTAHYAGKLDTIYLYCNKDITENSQQFTRIKQISTSAGMKIELITGQTILDQVLDFPTILATYFGLNCLDEKWFQENLELSLKNLGRRYNSLFNINTEAQKNLALFLQEPEGITAINKKKENLTTQLNRLRWNCEGKYSTVVGKLIKWVKSLDDVDDQSFLHSLEWKSLFEEECHEIFAQLRERLTSVQEKMEKLSYSAPEYKELRNEELTVELILKASDELDFSDKEKSMVNCKTVIITGKMGTGKSQLLATSAKRMIDEGRPALLLLGQTFNSNDNIENQIMNNLTGISTGQSFESLVSVMDVNSESTGKDAVIFIDAVNESTSKDAWKNGVNGIINTIEKSNHVKLVISLRTGFEELTLSQNVLDKEKSDDIAQISHTGLADSSPSKIYEFLSHYEIPFSPEYYLHSEMTNPLFLTWFCTTYNGEEQGLLTLIDEVLRQADSEASKSAGYPEPVGMLKPLIYEILDVAPTGNINKQQLLQLHAWSTFGVIKKINYLNAIERAGVLASFVREGEETYYFGYNLLEDYLKAKKIIDTKHSKEEIIEYCENNLLGINAEGRITNRLNESVFATVAALYAVQHSDELVEVIDKVKSTWDKNSLTYAYYSSFIWRSSHITYDNFLELLNKYPPSREQVWEIFIENSVKKESELNALGLTKLLKRYPLNRRDYLWTTVINGYDENNRIISLAYSIEAGNTLKGLSENKAYLLSITYTWMLSSSNRILRDRVSKAMIEILKDHFQLCKKLLELFKDVDDPYILQRLYGIIFGAVMKRKQKNITAFKDLAQWVYKEIFGKDIVYPDILLRDYARLIIERFATEFPNDLDGIQLQKIKPPYKSDPIPVIEPVDYDVDEYKKEGLLQLLYSMKFNLDVNGIGFYGDFGRYVFQSALEQFINLDITNIYYYALHYILNELCYDSSWFGQYDKQQRSNGSHHVKRIERIGKKYQWIAMHNILARVSDTYNIKNWNDNVGTPYVGPWDPYVRDFDPTLNTKIHGEEPLPQITVPQYGKESFCDINPSDDKIQKWLKQEDKMFQDFPGRFIHTDETGKEWVSLYLYQENKLQLGGEEPPVFDSTKEKQEIWTIAIMHILPETQKYDGRDFDLIAAQLMKRNPNDLQSCYSLFSREYAWSPGYNAEFNITTDKENGLDANAFTAAARFLWEEEYDASQEEPTSFAIPAGQIIRDMRLYEKDVDGIYYQNEEIVAFDLTLTGNENTEMIIRRDILNKYLEKTGFQAFWTVVGEKQFFPAKERQKWLRQEGYFIYNKKKVTGNIHPIPQAK